jgi:hypothetical protein
MKIIFYNEIIKNEQILFWTYVVSIIVMIILAIIFVGKELKNEHK